LEKGLEELEGEGFVAKISQSPPRYRWVHDKIHEAAIALIPENARGAWKRRVGEILLSELDEAELDSAVFIVVDLMNGSLNVDLGNSEAKLKLAQLNYRASLKAVNVSAFEGAAMYAGKGIELLPANCWDEHYGLSLRLHSIGAKAEGFIGNFTAMERYCRAVLAQEDRPIEDKFEVYHAWIDGVSNLAKMQEAADLSLEILEKFKCRFPKNRFTIGLGILYNVIRVRATMKSRDPLKLLCMDDKTRVELMRFLDKLATCFYILKDDRMPLVIFRSLNWTFKYGFCDYSPPTLATAGMMLTGILDDLQGGAQYGQHAIDLLSHTSSKSTAARTMFCVYTFLFSWTRPIRTLLKPLLEAYDVGLQTG
jgi:predicted ATPase